MVVNVTGMFLLYLSSNEWLNWITAVYLSVNHLFSINVAFTRHIFSPVTPYRATNFHFL